MFKSFKSGSTEAAEALAAKRVMWAAFVPMSHLEAVVDVRAGLPGQEPSAKGDVVDRGFEDWSRAVERVRRAAHVLGCRECLLELRERLSKAV